MAEMSVQNLVGQWQRSVISFPDGRRDETTRVTWLQGPGLYIDLRQPADLAAFPKVECLRGLSREQLAELARQEGFAGRFVKIDDYFEWQRVMDLQPRSLFADQGFLFEEQDYLVEEGRVQRYREHWHLQSTGQGAVGAFALRDPISGAAGFLVRVGAVFMLARGRTVSLPSGRPLSTLVAEASSLEVAQTLLDCEIAFGRVQAGGDWLIEVSSLPFRAGVSVNPARTSSRDLLWDDLATDGRRLQRVWQIRGEEGDAAIPQA